MMQSGNRKIPSPRGSEFQKIDPLPKFADTVLDLNGPAELERELAALYPGAEANVLVLRVKRFQDPGNAF